MRSTLPLLLVLCLATSLPAAAASRFETVKRFRATFELTLHATSQERSEPQGEGTKTSRGSIAGRATVHAILVDDGYSPDSKGFSGPGQFAGGTLESKGSVTLRGKGGTVLWSDAFSASEADRTTDAHLIFDASRRRYAVSCPSVAFKGQWRRHDEIPHIPSVDETEEGEERLAAPESSYVPVPESGMTLSGVVESEGHVIPERAMVVLKPRLTCRYTLEPLDAEPEAQVSIDGSRCGCDGKLKLQARTALSGGKFEPFEVQALRSGEPSLRPAKVTRNEGGVLELRSEHEYALGAEVTAVYVKQGKRYRSKPTEVRFCRVVKPEVLEPKGGLSRGNGRDFLFSSTTPGTVEVKLRGGALLGERDVSDELSWVISPEDGDFRAEHAKAKEQRFFAEALFASNEQFGPRRIRSVYKGEGCECQSEEVEIRLFYPLRIANNPDGAVPNWAYYWRQTKAGQDIDFEFAKIAPETPACALPLSDPASDKASARYDYCADQIYLTPWIAKDGGCMGRMTRDQDQDQGIDCFAVTLRHENHHRRELVGWWGRGVAGYSKTLDPDMDLVPSEVEDGTPGCSSLEKFSCRGRPSHLHDVVSDIELNAYRVGWTWKRGTADSEDWSYPGKQWPKEKNAE